MDIVLRTGQDAVTPEFGRSIVNQLAGPAVLKGHYEFKKISVVEKGSAVVIAEGGEIILGRAVECPAKLSTAVKLPKKIKVSCVVMLQDDQGRVLVTRRAQTMRAFPQAWVCPGGGSDEGETLINTAARELLEETGLTVDPTKLSLRFAWESVYPTTVPACVESGGITSHSLMFIYTSSPSPPSAPVTLQASETDNYVWLPPTFYSTPSDAGLDGQHGEVPGEALRGIYPNSCGEGIAQGHLFGLEELCNKQAIHNL
eukprot:TRINITY_DN27942_c0_g1_i1.p1 TRINITY_DN27942_c0_g1~~TRINITY_DN27942_c0_g1_i1.p1  ORF type:complete len:257 (+),score=36.22 TRINITY_DN27942_c0_g1_i1:86-856(+)